MQSNRKPKLTPHTGWYKMRNIPWRIARCCGLVALNNKVSRKAVKAGCDKS